MEVKHRFFEHDIFPGGFWFRVRGYGLHVIRRAMHSPLFSERHGYVKPLYIGPLRFEALWPRGKS